MDCLKLARMVAAAVLIAACGKGPLQSQQTVEPPPAASDGSTQPAAAAGQEAEADALFHYIRGVAEELDAMMSGSEDAARSALERSVAEFESVIRLGFSRPALRLNLARTLRYLGGRTENSQV